MSITPSWSNTDKKETVLFSLLEVIKELWLPSDVVCRLCFYAVTFAFTVSHIPTGSVLRLCRKNLFKLILPHCSWITKKKRLNKSGFFLRNKAGSYYYMALTAVWSEPCLLSTTGISLLSCAISLAVEKNYLLYCRLEPQRECTVIAECLTHPKSSIHLGIIWWLPIIHYY